MIKYLIILAILLPKVTFGQLTATTLPIVKIDTEDLLPIFDEPKRKGTVSIIYNGNGATNFLSSTDYIFTSNIGIEIRGESSQSAFPKKSYLFETWDEEGNDKDTSFLNFPSEEDFILYAPYSDKTLLNNALAMQLSNEMGHYASRTRYVELVVNDEYQGVYIIMEKIKRDKDRVDIAKLNADEISGDDLTGGYIFRIDKGNHAGWPSKYTAYDGPNPVFFQYYYPAADDIVSEQEIYIRSYVDEFEKAIASPDYTNDQGKHYADYINLRSFIDNFILNELSKNVDAYRLSTYFHKDKDSKGGKLEASPVWDYNLSFGNADYCKGDNVEGWLYYQCTGNSPFWWDIMFNDDFFIDGLKCRWESLRSDILSEEYLMSWIDEQSNELIIPAGRNFNRWPILGTYIWPNPDYFVEATTYDQVINTMKNVIKDRLLWLDENIPGVSSNCTFYDNLEAGISPVGEELIASDHVNVFPNPSTDKFNISSSSKIDHAELYDMLGNLIESRNVDNRQYQFSLGSKVASGTYILSLKLGDTIVQKIIVIQ